MMRLYFGLVVLVLNGCVGAVTTRDDGSDGQHFGADSGDDVSPGDSGGGDASPGDSNGGDTTPIGDDDETPIEVLVVVPASATLSPGGTRQFSCRTSGGASVSGCVWSAPSGGTINGAGLFTAPETEGTYSVVATSPSNETASAVVIVPPAATGEPGVWERILAGQVSMDPNYNSAGNYGAQVVLVDPARPTDVYVTVCYQGVWKSVDYGLTFTKVNTGTNGNKIDQGRPWSAAIDSNPERDPSTPPTLYSTSGYGAQDLWKSVDGGVNWTNSWSAKTVLAANGVTNITSAVGVDIGNISIDPADGNHVILSLHGNDQGYSDHVFETHDGGDTWIDKGPVGHVSLVYMIDSETWLAQGDWFHGGTTRQTNNAGTTWTTISETGHSHGGTGFFRDGDQVYFAALGGTYQSANKGGSWSKIPSSTDSSVVVATPTTVYTSYGWAYLGDVEPVLGRASRNGGSWTADPAPDGMSNGGVSWALTSDGTHYIIIAANWHGGFWRYVEPL